MEGGAPQEDSRGPELDPRPFSVVLAPAATVAVHKEYHHSSSSSSISCRTSFVRHLHIHEQHHSSSGSSSIDSRPSKRAPSFRIPSRLSGVVVAVKAQPRTLHLFRGRRLCRVVEFSSPISDVAGFPPGSSPLHRSGILCVVVCRDGTAYALPTAEVLNGDLGVTQPGKTEDLSKLDGAGSGVSTAPTQKGDIGSSSSSSSRGPSSLAAVGIFEDLAPTIVARGSPPKDREAPNQKQRINYSGGGIGGPLGALVLRAQGRWAIFSHLGAKTVALCNGGGAAAVAGIIDPAAVYGLAPSGDEPEAPAGRSLGTLGEVDGAAPATSCVIWMADGSGGTSCDSKGFPLPSAVFRALFGAELALSGGPSPSQPSQPQPPPPRDSESTTSGNHGTKESNMAPPSVVLVGDEAGTVRWCPARPHPGVSGGVLARLSTAIVGTLPQLDAESRVVGVLVVGANGSVLSLTASAAPRRISRKRGRPGDVANGHREECIRGGGRVGGSTSPEDCGSAGSVGTLSACRRPLRVPFPISTVCSAPGVLVHCYAGALFASTLPVAVPGEEADEQDAAWHGGWGGSLHGSGGTRSQGRPPVSPAEDAKDYASFGVPAPLRPIRLPLPCDTIGLAVAPLLAEEVARDASADHSTTTPRTLVVALSARGRLVGFMSPRSTEELEGWGLDNGKGGVRVGGSAGVERRVRCQLERLSSVGKQCAALSAESAGQDHEIQTLRGATGLFPPLDTADAFSSAAQRNRGGGARNAAPASLGYGVTMTADVEEATGPAADSCGGTERFDALQVRLRVRLRPSQGGGARNLPGAREGGAGRWFVITRISPAYGGGSDAAVAEGGWSWSTSAFVSMASLRQGWPWRHSAALSLPSARPVTVTSWLQFRFGAEADGDGNPDGRSPHGSAAGVCLELGSNRFDVLDWGVRLSSIPGNAAAVRGAARGRGACFCGPELAIADVLERERDASSARCRGTDGGPGGGPSARLSVPAAWRSLRLRVASPHYGTGTLLGLLVPDSSKPTHPAVECSSGALGSESGAPTEVAIRVAGQVVVARASAGTAGAIGAGVGVYGHERAPASGEVEIAVTCSHEAMAPLVREALLHRARALPSGRKGTEGDIKDRGENVGARAAFGDGEIARGDAAARLVREVHPMGQAIADAGEAARVLGAARANDGPSIGTAKEALALMCRVGEIYQVLRRQQEGVDSLGH